MTSGQLVHATALPATKSRTVDEAGCNLAVDQNLFAAASAAKVKWVKVFLLNLNGARNGAGGGVMVRPEKETSLAADVGNVEFSINSRNESENQSLDDIDGIIKEHREVPVQVVPLR